MKRIFLKCCICLLILPLSLYAQKNEATEDKYKSKVALDLFVEKVLNPAQHIFDGEVLEKEYFKDKEGTWWAIHLINVKLDFRGHLNPGLIEYLVKLPSPRYIDSHGNPRYDADSEKESEYLHNMNAGHPHPETLAYYEKNKVPTLITRKDVILPTKRILKAPETPYTDKVSKNRRFSPTFTNYQVRGYIPYVDEKELPLGFNIPASGIATIIAILEGEEKNSAIKKYYGFDSKKDIYSFLFKQPNIGGREGVILEEMKPVTKKKVRTSQIK